MKEHAEPHFDDERTLLSARPVVPLEKIDAKARHRRQWFLGGAFAIAMMLGAASALLASYLKLRNVPQTAAELSVEPDIAPAAVAVVDGAPVETPIAESENLETSEEIATPPVMPKKASVPKRRAVVAEHNPEPVEDRDTRQMNEDDDLERIRDAVLYDQWQERRARRATRRERRRAERYNHRDLSNLNEIFEGRRRP
jgi:predicted RNase H-like nuclease (RuvC/YqgF family)